MCNNLYLRKDKGDRPIQPGNATSKLDLALLVPIFWLGTLHNSSKSSQLLGEYILILSLEKLCLGIGSGQVVFGFPKICWNSKILPARSRLATVLP